MCINYILRNDCITILFSLSAQNVSGFTDRINIYDDVISVFMEKKEWSKHIFSVQSFNKASLYQRQFDFRDSHVLSNLSLFIF